MNYESWQTGSHEDVISAWTNENRHDSNTVSKKNKFSTWFMNNRNMEAFINEDGIIGYAAMND